MGISFGDTSTQDREGFSPHFSFEVSNGTLILIWHDLGCKAAHFSRPFQVSPFPKWIEMPLLLIFDQEKVG